MKGRAVVPLVDIKRRPMEAGRIRMGEKVATKSGKGSRPTALTTFRLTSPSRELIDAAAKLYGGTTTPWNEKGPQWQVTTDVHELPVVLIPEGLTTVYELWAGGGRKRFCDGIECAIRQRCGPDDYEEVTVPCLCVEEGGSQACKPTTRLQVFLVGLPFAGTWRLESKGWNSAQELPGMHDAITALATGQMIQAVLGFNQRTTSIDVGDGSLKREFVVPYLRIEQTIPELLAGRAGLVAISASGQAIATPALPRMASDDLQVALNSPVDAHGRVDIGGEVGEPIEFHLDAVDHLRDHIAGPQDDDGITDAEIVDDDDLDARLRADAENFGLDPAKFIAAVRVEFKGDEAAMAACSADVRAGRREPISVKFGKVQWETKR